MLFYCAAILMVAAMLLGGGGGKAGYLSDAILQLIATPVYILALWHHSHEKLNLTARLAVFFCFALAVVPLVQLIPLPLNVHEMLPSHAVVSASLNAAEMSVNWLPISVSPRATWLSLAALLPPLSMFLITLLLGYKRRQLLCLIIIVFGLVSVFVGLLQVAQGPSSTLHFFEGAGSREATGFFANRNHFAALVYSLIVLTAAWLVALVQKVLAAQGREKSKENVASFTKLVLSGSIVIVFIGAEMMARSRAGIGLTIIALLGVSVLTMGGMHGAGVAAGRLRKSMIGVGAAVLVVFMLSTQFALYRIMERFDSNLFENGRAAIATNTIEAAWAFMPTGSGMGTFVPVYALFEKATELRTNKFINRAHNDLLEFWLEAGVAAFVLILLFAGFFTIRAIAVWRHPRPGGEVIDQMLARSATLVIALLLAHSFVDYPLRTGAMACIFAFACALLVDPLARPQERHKEVHKPSNAVRHHDAKVQPQRSEVTQPIAVPKPLDQTDWGKEIDWPSDWGGGKKTGDPDEPD